MKTYYVATTTYDRNPWEDFGYTNKNDYVIFSDADELRRFVSGEYGFNALDDVCRIFEGEHLNRIFCIWAENYLAAVDRACALCRR